MHCSTIYEDHSLSFIENTKSCNCIHFKLFELELPAEFELHNFLKCNFHLSYEWIILTLHAVICLFMMKCHLLNYLVTGLVGGAVLLTFSAPLQLRPVLDTDDPPSDERVELLPTGQVTVEGHLFDPSFCLPASVGQQELYGAAVEPQVDMLLQGQIVWTCYWKG